METYIHVVTPELNPNHSWWLISVNPLGSGMYVSSYNSNVSDDTMGHKISRRYHGYLCKTERLKSIRIDWVLQWFVIGEFMTKGNIEQSLFQYSCFCPTDCHWPLRGLIVKSAEHCGADYKPLDRCAHCACVKPSWPCFMWTSYMNMMTLTQTHAIRICKSNYTSQNTVGCNYLSMF